MGIATLLALAVGLSMDAFAVSISNGMSFKNMGKKPAIYGAVAFGVFQGLMPILGYFVGQTFASLIQSLDHWVALILLGLIGAKMIWEAVSQMRSNEPDATREFSGKLIIVQAIATSIDALAVGVSFAVMSVNIWTASAFIAACTFLLCLIGVYFGRRFGGLLKEKAEIFGGIILILIGLKIFLEHMFG